MQANAFLSLSGQKEPKLLTVFFKQFTAFCLWHFKHCSVQSSRVFRFKSCTTQMTFTFPFSPPFFFPFFFTRLNFGGKRFWENIKDCSTYLTTFSLEFSGQFDNFYGLLGCSPACLTEMHSFWYGLKNLFPCAQVRWPLKQMKSQAKQGTWIHKYIIVTTS